MIPCMIPWINKHLPKSSSDIPQPSAVSDLRKFVSEFKKQKKKAALLYGPTGTCKSCAVYAIAKELGLEIVEINASDTRNADQINEKIGNALKQRSLFFSGKIVLVDDVDGVAGQQDRGGVSALASLIAEAAFPVVMTANDPWDKKFSPLRKKSVMIEFEALNHLSVYAVLKGICEKEEIKFDDSALKMLSRRSGGDLRGAINDLQTLAQGKKELTKESLDELGDRNKLDSIHQALIKVLKNSDPLIALGAFDTVDMDLDECMLWLDYNLPKEYTKPADLARAYDLLSKADVYRGRIRRWQHWRFLVYVSALMTAGVASAKDTKNAGAVKYEQTTRLLKIWQANMKYAHRKAIAEKIAEKTHCSIKRAIKSSLPYLKAAFKENSEFAAQLSEELKLDEEEIDWLKS